MVFATHIKIEIFLKLIKKKQPEKGLSKQIFIIGFLLINKEKEINNLTTHEITFQKKKFNLL